MFDNKTIFGKRRLRKRRKYLWMCMISAILLITACSSGTTPSAKPQQTSDSSGKASTPPAPSTQTTAETGKSGSSDWEQVVAAAKKEGKLVMSGDPSEAWRKSLVDLFHQDYPDIKIEFTGLNGRDFWPRLLKERELGKNLWDLRAGGVESNAYEVKNKGLLEPIRPLLLPEIADDSKWIGGLDGLFFDKENKFMVAYTIYVQPTVFVNRDFIPASELKSSEQILDPKYKNKMVMQTPTGGASFSALSNLGFMYGDNFVKNLLSQQNVVVTDDKRQQAEWVVRGKYPIAIGFNDTQLIPFKNQGLGKNVETLDDKIIPVATGLGGIMLLKDAPHPNAAKVYMNWLLSQKTQEQLIKNVLLNSKRKDVTPIVKELAVDPNNIQKYRQYSTEENVAISHQLLQVIKDALKQ